ncbi:MAG: nuclease A inhibitor family protein [Cyanobacteria bacterium J06607_6]
MTNHQLTAQLKQLTAGLWLPSETEAPWTVPTWTLTTGDAAEIRQVLRRAEDVSVTASSLHELMAQVQRRCRAYGAEGKAIAQQHQTLFDYLQGECDRVRVFRVGVVTIDVVIVGETADGCGILQTQSVET